MFQHVRLGPKRSKYGNIQTRVDGVRFSSKAESEHYIRLKLLQHNVHDMRTKVRYFCLQPVFVLADGITYRGDFLVVYEDGRVQVEDVKGHLTKEYKLKKKLMKSVHGIDIVEITR